MRRLAFLLLAIGLAGCNSNSPMARAAGHWEGSFYADTGAEMFRGYLQLYVTGEKFELHMTAPDESFTAKGGWKASGTHVQISPNAYDFQMPTTDEQKSLKTTLISADAVRKCLQHGVVFEIAPDRRALTGLKMSLDGRLGAFRFTRPIPK